MKLFIWDNVKNEDWETWCYMAVAETEEEAKAIISAKPSAYMLGNISMNSNYLPTNFNLRRATRTLDVPCGLLLFSQDN